MNLKQIEKALIQHLQESGEIRADLKWVKKAVWTVAAGGISWNVAVVSYLLLRSR